MSQSLHPMLNIAIKAARAAGAIINRGSQDLDLLTVTHKGPNDFVSEVDHAAEQVIIETLLAAYPGHAILAEESGREHGAKHSEYVWIIDPLDGTTNFLHGLPVYCVSIALAYRGVVQQAVVYDPNRNDLFYASKGRGAFLNDKRLRVSRRTRLADALVGTGFPFRRGDNFQRYIKMFELVMQSCAGLRRPGSAALDLCYVAAGWYDGFFETGLQPWDLAAGSLIITEAGGLCGNFTGEADFMFQRELVAGNPKIYAQLVTMLAPFTRVIKNEATDGAEGGQSAATMDGADSVLAALAQAGVDTAPAEAATPVPAAERKPLRVRKTLAEGEVAHVPTVSYREPSEGGMDPRSERPRPRGPRPDQGMDRPDQRRSSGPRPDPGRPAPARPGPRGPGDRFADRAPDRGSERSTGRPAPRGPAGPRGPAKPGNKF